MALRGSGRSGLLPVFIIGGIPPITRNICDGSTEGFRIDFGGFDGKIENGGVIDADEVADTGWFKFASFTAGGFCIFMVGGVVVGGTATPAGVGLSHFSFSITCLQKR